MKPHPQSITLAQSAMESAWGTSRFLQEANNVFGVWSFNKNEPRVAAGKKRGKTTIYVKKYATIADSIKDYYRVLATGRAFKGFRAAKMKTNNPYTLVKHLDKYSERGADYGKELASMIRYNKLTKYDD
jgi:Bax protein